MISAFTAVFCACSTQKAETDTSLVLPLMVIEKSEFDHDYQMACTHSSQCHAPLICRNLRCDIPPSLTGKTASDDPRLIFSGPGGKHEIAIEIASDSYTTQRGMMMRRYFASNWGMLFVFPNESPHAFWMQNTYIPLDMVFIRADGSVANFYKKAEPLNAGPRYLSKGTVKYVLELPAGSIDNYQIDTTTTFDNIQEFQVTSEAFYIR